MALRIIFMGTPDFAVPTLAALIGHGHEIVCVYSQPPRPSGRRGLETKKSPVHEKAEQFGIPVRTPLSFKSTDEQNAFIALEADVAVVVAYGQLLPDAILNAPRLGCYNGHASLLPRWRGAAPIQRAIMASDSETGMMVMKMDSGLDTGDIAMADKVAITPTMTAGELHDILMQRGADMMVLALSALERDSLQHTPQSADGTTYAKKILKGETRLDFSKPAQVVHNTIQGLSPFPGAWTEMLFGNKKERVKILKSELVRDAAKSVDTCGQLLDDTLLFSCGDNDAVRFLQLQKAGGKPLSGEDFLRGNSFELGSILN